MPNADFPTQPSSLYTLQQRMSGAHLLKVVFPVLPAALPLPVVEQLILSVDVPLSPTTNSSCPHNNASAVLQQDTSR